MSRSAADWDRKYREGTTPWDLGRPDRNLVSFVDAGTWYPGSLLDLGCGTGDNALWLAGLGFQVTGCDVSESAVLEARRRATEAGLPARFLVADLVRDGVPGGPFDIAFDRGCFHSFDDPEERRRFAENVARHLAPGGRWLSISGSTDDPPRDTGPPRRSATDLVTAVEPDFEVLSVEAGTFHSRRDPPPRAWILHLRRRVGPQTSSRTNT